MFGLRLILNDFIDEQFKPDDTYTHTTILNQLLVTVYDVNTGQELINGFDVLSNYDIQEDDGGLKYIDIPFEPSFVELTQGDGEYLIFF